MDPKSDSDKAEQVSLNRARAWPILALGVILAHQGVFFAWDWDAVQLVPSLIWTVLAIVMLVLALTGGTWLFSRPVRALTDDEVTRDNRAKSIMAGFAAAMITAILVFVIAPYQPLSAQRAAHLIFSMGVALSLMTFGLRELRSLA